MHLVLLQGTEVIDKISISPNKASDPDVLSFLKQELLLRNEEELEHRLKEIHFALDEVPSKMAYESLLQKHVFSDTSLLFG